MITSVYTPTTYVSTGGGVDGANTTFAIGFTFQLSTQIKVSVTDSTNTLQLQGQGTDYSVSGANVVFNSAPTSGRTVVIELNPDFKQSTEFPEDNNFPAAAVETSLDKLTLEAQALKEQVGRAIKTNILSSNIGTLGTMAQQDSNNVNITGGYITGLTVPLPVASGGSGAATTSDARTNLGLGTMATQNSTAVSISGGSIDGTVPSITGLTEDVTPDSNNDFTITYDASASANKKVKLVNLLPSTVNLSQDATPTLGGNLTIGAHTVNFTSVNVTDVTNDTTLAANSATIIPTEHAVKSYVDNAASSLTKHSVINLPIFLITDPKDGTVYASPSTQSTASGDVEPGGGFIFPISGTLSSMRIQLQTATTATNGLTITIRKNGSNSTITATVTNGSTTASDLTHTLAVVAGDYITVLFSATEYGYSSKNTSISLLMTG